LEIALGEVVQVVAWDTGDIGVEELGLRVKVSWGILFVGVIFERGGDGFYLTLTHGVGEGSFFFLLEFITDFVKFNQSSLAFVLVHQFLDQLLRLPS